MTTTSRFCFKCGATVPPDSPEESCAACLLEIALECDEPEIERDGSSSLGTIDAFGLPSKASVQVGEGVSVSPSLLEFAGYELLEQIGRGGQGVVFRARQKGLNRTVALKVINLGQWSSKAHVKRFRREAEAAARLDHAGIVPIHEVGERDGSCYFSMKFVEGGQLDEVVRHSAISIRQAVKLMAKVAHIVHYAHEHGILHRDIKPGNILLDAKGEPHLTDFGLARLLETESSVTQTLDVLGTPSYMAPEQAVGNNAAVTRATDVYGLGAVLYQLLTGQPPFAGGTTYETIKLLLDTEPRPPRSLNRKIDRDLSTICLKSIEKDPKRRYFSAFALAEDLERWLNHEPIQARRIGPFTRGKKWVRRNPTTAVMAAMLLALAIPLGIIVWNSEISRSPITTGIAVLPFENLSERKDDTAFADGVQDDILTKLAKIADLKVISRTSVMDFRGKRNLRQIGNDLHISHVLEGSVRKFGARLRINAQLIDARSDIHVWAEQYDRDLNDLFAIQSEIAQKVAQQLHTKISPAEKLAIERKPTGDLVAFDLYARAQDAVGHGEMQGWLKAIDLLNHAVARDPTFFHAYCFLASAHDALYSYGFDHSTERLALAERAIQSAAQLQPDAGETHLARAEHLYSGYRDYDRALAELEVARQKLPNDADVFELLGYIQRRQNRWEDSTRNLERAADLDPRSRAPSEQLSGNYLLSRHYAEAKRWQSRAQEIAPDDLVVKAQLLALDFHCKGDSGPLHELLDATRATNPAAMRTIADKWLTCALAERDPYAANDALAAFGENPVSLADDFSLNYQLVEALITRMKKNETKAHNAFVRARAEQEKKVQAEPNNAHAVCLLALIDAALGQREDALNEGRRAVRLLPMEKDALGGGEIIKYFTIAAAWAGETDLACEQLASLVRQPSPIWYGELKLLPFWDPLRGDPRFEKILASLAPKETASK